MRKPAATSGGTKVVGKPAKPAKATAPAVQKLQQQVASLQRQVTSLKHSPRAKHQPAAAPKHHKKRGLASVEGGLACCAAEALGMCLRLAGQHVADGDVEALYWLTARDADAGASIWATLAAAGEVPVQGLAHGLDEGPGALVLGHGAPFGERDHITAGDDNVLQPARRAVPSEPAHALILGVELPGPHAIAVAPDGTWWSWGEPFNPADWPGLVVEEAWTISFDEHGGG